MRILILSDLHIGPNARCNSMIPSNDPGRKTLATEPPSEDLMNSLLSSISKEHPNIDYIILPGDMADRGDVEQYECFDAFLHRLLSETKLSTDAVFYTPGNHDVDWKMMPQGTTKDANPSRWDRRFENMRNSAALSNKKNLYVSPYWAAWQDPQIFVLSINTAAEDYPELPNHPGTISGETFRDIQSFLQSIDMDTRIPKILLMHHHPIQYPNVFPLWKDFSIVQSQFNIFDLCADFAFDFIIHGHRHQPHFNTHVCENGHEVFIVSAGSVSHRFPSYVYNDISNQYHVLNLNHRHPTKRTWKGSLHSYSFSQSKKWRPNTSPERDGIAARVAFGPHISPDIAKQEIKPVVQSIVDQQNFCRYQDILDSVEYIDHLSPRLFLEVIKTICGELNLTIFGDQADRIVIVRGA